MPSPRKDFASKLSGDIVRHDQRRRFRTHGLHDFPPASTWVLSCPGPLRRHRQAIVPLVDLVLPQVLLGSESQLLAFAAGMPGLAENLFFAPLPEMFAGTEALGIAMANAGHRPGPVAHLRFGSMRSMRVLKGAWNAAMVAEAPSAVPVTASRHPFASGLVAPAAIQHAFVYGPNTIRPRLVTGADLPVTALPPGCVDADLTAARGKSNVSFVDEPAGLDIVSLADFRSASWAAGPVRGRADIQMKPGRKGAAGEAPVVLLPWNMDHPGSIIPDLLERLGSLRTANSAPLKIVVLPFNYLGQTGIIRQLILRLREAYPSRSGLDDVYLARLSRLSALGKLRRLSRVAWVDGNDPEHWWTMARLAACGIEAVLIEPQTGLQEPGPVPPSIFMADEPIWLEPETRYGHLSVPAWLPSLRALPALLALTEDRLAAEPPKPVRRSGRLRGVAT